MQCPTMRDMRKERLKAQIVARVTEPQYKRAILAAKKAELTLGQWVRDRLFGRD